MQSRSSETTSHSACLDISHVKQNQQLHFRVHQSLQLSCPKLQEFVTLRRSFLMHIEAYTKYVYSVHRVISHFQFNISYPLLISANYVA